MVIEYPWHPLHGKKVPLYRRAGRRGQQVVHVEVSDGLSRELPAWMFDAVACGRMTLGPPQASIAALNALSEVLALRRNDQAVDRRSDSSGMEDKSDEAIDKGDEQAAGALVHAR